MSQTTFEHVKLQIVPQKAILNILVLKLNTVNDPQGLYCQE
mgnify:CR=1 FL=1